MKLFYKTIALFILIFIIASYVMVNSIQNSFKNDTNIQKVTATPVLIISKVSEV